MSVLFLTLRRCGNGLWPGRISRVRKYRTSTPPTCPTILQDLKECSTALSASSLQELRKLMQSFTKPTNEQVEAALPLVSSPQHEAYFFSHLENPLWIEPLAEHKVFKYPPKAEPVAEGGLRYPPWPPSRYLARMAESAPVEVTKVFASLETDNLSIIGDALDAALVLPANLAAKLVP